MWTDVTSAAAFAFFWLLLVTLGFVLLSKLSASKPSRTRWMAISLPVLLLIATVVRLVPALVLPVGAGYDIESFRLVTDALLGGREVYTSVLGRHPYLPFQMYLMGAMAYLSDWTSLPYVVAIKLPAVAADVAIVGLIYYTLIREGRRREIAVYFGLLYALNPVSLLVTAYHGQFEPVTLLLLALAWFFWHFGRRSQSSAVFLGLAILHKTWPVVFLPIMLIRQRSWRARWVYGLLALAVPLLFLAFYLFLFSADMRPMLGRALTHRGVPGYWGPGAVLAPAGRYFPAAEALFEGLVAARNWLLIAAVLFALWRTRQESALKALLTVILSMLAVTVGFGNQWLLWPLPFALLARQGRAARWYSLTAALMMTVHLYGANMVAWLPQLLPVGPAEWLFRLSALPVWFVVVAWAYYLLRRVRPGEPVVTRIDRAVIGLSVFTLIVGSALLIYTQTQPDISDSIGYTVAGERLAGGKGLTYEDGNNVIAGHYFVPYAFQVSRPDDPAHYLGFPPGFPLLLAAGKIVGGDALSIHYVVPLIALLALIATYFLGVSLTDDRTVGFWAAVLLASTAAFWRFGTAAWSEMPATLAVTAGIVLFLKSRQAKSRLFFSLLAAIVLSFGHFIRYTNVVFLAAPAAYELYTARGTVLTERWRWPFWIALAAGLAAIPLFNHYYYGGALLTSYSPTHGWYPLPPFSLAYALGPSFVNGYSLRESLKTMWTNFPLLLLLAPLGWWLLPKASRILVASVVGFGLLAYIFYAFAPTGINSRFLLPIYPFICVAIARLIATALARLARPSLRWGIGLVMAIGLIFLMSGHWPELNERNAAGRSTVAFTRDLTAKLEPNAVVLSYVYNDMIAIYGGRSVLNYRRIPASDPSLGRYRVEMLEPCLVGSVDRLLARSIPVYYVEDQQPPYWDSLAILQRHFAMAEIEGDPPIHQILNRSCDSRLDESGCRFQ